MDTRASTVERVARTEERVANPHGVFVDPTASWPLCAVCGKSAREGRHAFELGEGHEYEPSAAKAPMPTGAEFEASIVHPANCQCPWCRSKRASNGSLDDIARHRREAMAAGRAYEAGMLHGVESAGAVARDLAARPPTLVMRDPDRLVRIEKAARAFSEAREQYDEGRAPEIAGAAELAALRRALAEVPK